MEDDETKIENDDSPSDKLDLNELNTHYDESGEQEPEEQSQPQQQHKEQEFFKVKLSDCEFEMASNKFNVLDLMNLFLQLRERINDKGKSGGSYLG